MRARRFRMLVLTFLIGLPCKGDAQRCGTGLSSEIESTPAKLAQRNVDMLFDGIPLAAGDNRTAVRIVEDAWNALVKLDYREASYRQRFDALLRERNSQLLALARTATDSAKLLACFAEMRQPIPSGQRPKQRPKQPKN